MTQRDAKILALTFLSEWAWDCKDPTACRDMVLSDRDAQRLARAFESLGMELYLRRDKLRDRSKSPSSTCICYPGYHDMPGGREPACPAP